MQGINANLRGGAPYKGGLFRVAGLADPRGCPAEGGDFAKDSLAGTPAWPHAEGLTSELFGSIKHRYEE